MKKVNKSPSLPNMRPLEIAKKPARNFFHNTLHQSKDMSPFSSAST